MNLNDDELRHLRYCVTFVMGQRTPYEVRPWLQRLYDRLESELRMSRLRHDFDCNETELEVKTKQISAREAAMILGVSTRQVQRIAADLDGARIDGRYVFDESVVREYANARLNRKAA